MDCTHSFDIFLFNPLEMIRRVFIWVKLPVHKLYNIIGKGAFKINLEFPDFSLLHIKVSHIFATDKNNKKPLQL